MMFIYIVHAKFSRYNSVSIEASEVNENSWFTVYDNRVQFLERLGKTIGLKPKADKLEITTFRKRMWDDPRNYIQEYKKSRMIKGKFDLGWDKEKNKEIYVPVYEEISISKLNCVDTDDSPENVVEWITDYDNLDLHYERLFGLKNIGVCEMCGHLYRKGNGNNQRYCYKHRGYQKKGMKLVKCEDCGKEFYIPATNKRQVRCEECQVKRRKEAKRIAAQNRRNREKVDVNI